MASNKMKHLKSTGSKELDELGNEEDNELFGTAQPLSSSTLVVTTTVLDFM